MVAHRTKPPANTFNETEFLAFTKAYVALSRLLHRARSKKAFLKHWHVVRVRTQIVLSEMGESDEVLGIFD
eukprot:1592423-Amphidinium_carterae.1